MALTVTLQPLGGTPVRFRIENRGMPWPEFEAGAQRRTGCVGPLDFYVDGGKVYKMSLRKKLLPAVMQNHGVLVMPCSNYS